jgi:hypothetical protein
MIDHQLVSVLGAASGAPHDGQSLRAIVDAHPGAEAPRLYSVAHSVGGVMGDYLSRSDLLRVIESWRKMVLGLPS